MTRFCSIFSQLLQLFSRNDFQKAVKETKAERHARGFRSWDQFIAMLFCQLGRAHSLREICGGLASCEGKLNHVGAKVPRRTTLAYANEHRPWRLFEAVFYQLLEQCQQVAQTKQRRFRFKNKLLSMDGTFIELCAEVFPWAEYSRTKGGVKLHFTLDHDGYLPTMMVLTTGKGSELAVARRQSFTPGSIVTFDRGYTDFKWFNQLTQADVFFVTRLKKVATYDVVEAREVPENRSVISDQLVRFTARRTKQRYPKLLRLVVIETEEGQLEFLTNNFKLGASTIARIYKDRWQIELFFKALKQNLRVKTFVGTSANALHIQIWTALIAVLILKYLQMKAQFGWSFSNLAALLGMQLFVYRNLWVWLNDPYTPPPPPAEDLQATLTFA
jgi:Transposase DDE domain/Domain of unknown function (DUF4372)